MIRGAISPSRAKEYVDGLPEASLNDGVRSVYINGVVGGLPYIVARINSTAKHVDMRDRVFGEVYYLDYDGEIKTGPGPSTAAVKKFLNLPDDWTVGGYDGAVPTADAITYKLSPQP